VAALRSRVFGIDAWVVIGVLLIGGYAYWVYTDLVRPWLGRNEPYEWEADDEPSEPRREDPPDGE